MSTILLNQEQIKKLISVKDVVDAVGKTFKGLGEGTVINSTKLNLNLGKAGEYPNFSGYMSAMPA